MSVGMLLRVTPAADMPAYHANPKVVGDVACLAVQLRNGKNRKTGESSTIDDPRNPRKRTVQFGGESRSTQAPMS